MLNFQVYLENMHVLFRRLAPGQDSLVWLACLPLMQLDVHSRPRPGHTKRLSKMDTN